ncbi:ABC transporter ATP-binding protein [Cellulomonas triticagri]|uniref:ABC transporter ATP-binding protein n=1 Tax=Cellulomonas triticagri TaxID=2483352 RepID=A0A3M2JFC3_9CELL|nr:ABC transporter ATP-binding protein [Cellulomonas triticagri]RMI09685.1 ABC transporter ATP-binding protein [Cellulomonas triticagri]
MTRPALHARGLRRAFGDRIAVDDVSVRIDPGEIVCVLGPNGAGKTTTVRMCATLLTPTAGSVEVDGVDAVADPRAARRRTGLVLGGDAGFYSRASARKNLLFFADVAGVPRSERHGRVTSALEAVSLLDRADDPVRAYSRGMRQRLHLARGLLGRPRLLLLDEPTSGLDPQVAAETRTLVRALADSGAGVLLTSHHMAEVEQLADRIHVVVGGREVAHGSVAEISSASGVGSVTTFTTALGATTLAAAVDGLAGPLDVTDEAGRWRVRIPWRGAAREDLVRQWCLAAGGGVPVDLVTRPATLEESYLALVGASA